MTSLEGYEEREGVSEQRDTEEMEVEVNRDSSVRSNNNWLTESIQIIGTPTLSQRRWFLLIFLSCSTTRFILEFLFHLATHSASA